MAGRGPAPKPAHSRARRNAAPVAARMLVAEPVPQPPLPDGVPWHPRTVEWWASWGASPLTSGWTAVEWEELLVAALLHSQVWSGELRWAAELRLRVAKVGATAEDRLRLRIDLEPPAPAEGAPRERAASRWGDLRALPQAT